MKASLTVNMRHVLLIREEVDIHAAIRNRILERNSKSRKSEMRDE